MCAHKLPLIRSGQWTMSDTFEFQTFCEFCNRCFTSGIVWTPPPTLSALWGIFRPTVSSPVKICLCCACETLHMCSLRNAVLFCTHHLWLFLWGFSQSSFHTVMKKLYEFFSWLWHNCVIYCYGCFFSLCANFAILLKKILSPCELQKHKHMP